MTEFNNKELPTDDDFDLVSFDVIKENSQMKSKPLEDNRDYVDRIFQEFTTDGITTKPISKILCRGNDEPELQDGQIAVLVNYKSIKTRGRKMPLAGCDVLHIDTPSGSLRLPLDQAEKFAKYLVSAAKSANKSIG